MSSKVCSVSSVVSVLNWWWFLSRKSPGWTVCCTTEPGRGMLLVSHKFWTLAVSTQTVQTRWGRSWCWCEDVDVQLSGWNNSTDVGRQRWPRQDCLSTARGGSRARPEETVRCDCRVPGQCCRSPPRPLPPAGRWSPAWSRLSGRRNSPDGRSPGRPSCCRPDVAPERSRPQHRHVGRSYSTLPGSSERSHLRPPAASLQAGTAGWPAAKGRSDPTLDLSSDGPAGLCSPPPTARSQGGPRQEWRSYASV